MIMIGWRLSLGLQNGSLSQLSPAAFFFTPQHPFAVRKKGSRSVRMIAHKSPSRRHFECINRLLRIHIYTLLNFLRHYRPPAEFISHTSENSEFHRPFTCSRWKEITRKVRLIKRFIVLDFAARWWNTLYLRAIVFRTATPAPRPTPAPFTLPAKSKHILCEYN